MIFYEIFRWLGVITGLPAHLLFFKKKIYYENREKQGRRVRGGALIVSNHFSPFDYVLNVVVFFPRKLWVVASEDAFPNKLQSFGMKFWGGIKADRRTKSPFFITESIKHLKKDHLVQIFPEGHNTPDGKIHEFYPSYILIALRSGKPIIPVVTDGNYGIFKRTHLIIGEPIVLADYLEDGRQKLGDIERLNGIVHAKVLELREELEQRKSKK